MNLSADFKHEFLPHGLDSAVVLKHSGGFPFQEIGGRAAALVLVVLGRRGRTRQVMIAGAGGGRGVLDAAELLLAAPLDVEAGKRREIVESSGSFWNRRHRLRLTGGGNHHYTQPNQLKIQRRKEEKIRD